MGLFDWWTGGDTKFTRKEHTALAAVLMNMSMIDGDFDKSESKEMIICLDVAGFNSTNVSDFENLIASAQALTPDKSVQILRGMSRYKKRISWLGLKAVANADGRIDKNEDKLLSILQVLLDK